MVMEGVERATGMIESCKARERTEDGMTLKISYPKEILVCLFLCGIVKSGKIDCLKKSGKSSPDWSEISLEQSKIKKVWYRGRHTVNNRNKLVLSQSISLTNCKCTAVAFPTNYTY